MHYHLEVIMPPVANVEEALKQILDPFNEQGTDKYGERNTHGFWDRYVIGGRWAGVKLERTIDPKKKEEFFAALTARNVTVSTLQAGKQKLQPESQIPMVDALWNEMFPESAPKSCPFFDHFDNRYGNSDGFPDVMLLKDTPRELGAATHVIIAGPHWKEEGKLEAKHMLQRSVWNGVTRLDTKWNGSVQAAIEQHKEQLQNGKPEHAAKHMPQDDWLAVTVDYHS